MATSFYTTERKCLPVRFAVIAVEQERCDEVSSCLIFNATKAALLKAQFLLLHSFCYFKLALSNHVCNWTKFDH